MTIRVSTVVRNVLSALTLVALLASAGPAGATPQKRLTDSNAGGSEATCKLFGGSSSTTATGNLQIDGRAPTKSSTTTCMGGLLDGMSCDNFSNGNSECVARSTNAGRDDADRSDRVPVDEDNVGIRGDDGSTAATVDVSGGGVDTSGSTLEADQVDTTDESSAPTGSVAGDPLADDSVTTGSVTEGAANTVETPLAETTTDTGDVDPVSAVEEGEASIEEVTVFDAADMPAYQLFEEPES